MRGKQTQQMALFYSFTLKVSSDQQREKIDTIRLLLFCSVHAKVSHFYFVQMRLAIKEQIEVKSKILPFDLSKNLSFPTFSAVFKYFGAIIEPLISKPCHYYNLRPSFISHFVLPSSRLVIHFHILHSHAPKSL